MNGRREIGGGGGGWGGGGGGGGGGVDKTNKKNDLLSRKKDEIIFNAHDPSFHTKGENDAAQNINKKEKTKFRKGVSGRVSLQLAFSQC